ncbi:Unknown protein, partial [Striga hermonthica]
RYRSPLASFNQPGEPRIEKTRLVLSTFNGTDPNAWLNQAMQYFNINEIHQPDWVQYAAYYLDGEANIWWQWLSSIYQDRNEQIRWEDFEKKLIARFGVSDYHNYDEALSHIKKTGSVSEFQREFERLACRVRGWPERALVGAFIGGLKFDLAAEVRLERPSTMREAIEIARRRDDHLSATQKARRGDKNPTEPSRTALDAHMRNRREKGQCYKCGERFTPGHRCKQAYMIQVVDSDDEEELKEVETRHYIKEDLEISVNAMLGVQGPRTIKLPASVRGRSIEVLVDIGSSHNFISAILVDALKLLATKVDPFDVRVVNGEKLRCHKYYRDVPINLQGETIKADLYSLPLVGPDIVLGVQWLEGLGEVKTNYKEGIMKFYLEKRLIILKIKLRGTVKGTELRFLELMDEENKHKRRIPILEDKDVLKGGGNDTEVVIDPTKPEHGSTRMRDSRWEFFAKEQRAWCLEDMLNGAQGVDVGTLARARDCYGWALGDGAPGDTRGALSESEGSDGARGVRNKREVVTQAKDAIACARARRDMTRMNSLILIGIDK